MSINGLKQKPFAESANVISIPCFLHLYFKSIYTAYAI
ncbi:hypothetical protein RINTU1_04230 [Candidatus Regiella insecticola]|uniref:Uncharacterized protein n=1 Tax=Candidatus Regiella insecticola TaxID=138073 RepID=A0A6L2ZM99_9ENTR|nr:hypothetical protein RINTU1_04230 [Candidatus Regiella insecticola]